MIIAVIYHKNRWDIFPIHQLILFMLAGILITSILNAQSWAPFVIPGSMSTTSPINFSLPPITTSSPRLIANGSQFTVNGIPVKLWGMNVTFSSDFPDKGYAATLAARIAAAGINCVRFHHMDTENYPNGIWNSWDGSSIDQRALDRLDYFVAQLADHGVYSDINLHVGRTYSNYLGLPNPGTDYDKIADIFTPALLPPQKNYANQLLNHVNPYRGVRDADDPAVALVEISNEDSFFMWDNDASIQAFPSYYANILQTQYNTYLLGRYGSTSALSTAWSAGIDSTGPNMLLNPTMQNTTANGSIQNWVTEIDSSSSFATTMPYYRAPYNGARLQIPEIDGTDWHLQFEQDYLTVQAGHYYTVIFKGAADTTRIVSVEVTMYHSPWSDLGLGTSLTLNSTWSDYTFGFFATTSDTNARLSFSIGASTTTMYLANMDFHEGGQNGLSAGEYLETTTVKVYGANESIPRTRDRLRFFAVTEKNYFDTMRSYVKDTIGSGAMVTGTIVFGPLGLYGQSDMDYIDSHAYWQHPQFPGVAWDPVNWFIEQIAMTDNPSSATLFPLACERLVNKPHTVTEYNHPAPNDYQAEDIPMISSFAAAQDWSGVFMFDYGNPTSAPDPQAFSGYFDHYVNAAKFGFAPAGAAMLRNGAVTPLPVGTPVSLVTSGDPLGDLVELSRLNGNTLSNSVSAITGYNWQQPLSFQLGVTISTSPSSSLTGGSGSSISWQTTHGNGFYWVQGPGAWTFTGYTTDFAYYTYGQITVNSPTFVAMTITPLDATNFTGAHHLLISACGRCQNTGMIFSSDRTTVNNNWGYAPVLIEPVDAVVTLPPGTWTCQSLGPDGSPQTSVPVTRQSGSLSVHLTASYGTMWYLLTRTNITTSVPNYWMFFY